MDSQFQTDLSKAIPAPANCADEAAGLQVKPDFVLDYEYNENAFIAFYAAFYSLLVLNTTPMRVESRGLSVSPIC